MEFQTHWKFRAYHKISDPRKGPANILIPLSPNVYNTNIINTEKHKHNHSDNHKHRKQVETKKIPLFKKLGLKF